MLLLRAGSDVRVPLLMESVFQVLLSRGTPVGSLGFVDCGVVLVVVVLVGIEVLDVDCGWDVVDWDCGSGEALPFGVEVPRFAVGAGLPI